MRAGLLLKLRRARSLYPQVSRQMKKQSTKKKRGRLLRRTVSLDMREDEDFPIMEDGLDGEDIASRVIMGIFTVVSDATLEFTIGM